MNPLIESRLLLDGRNVSFYSHKKNHKQPWIICFSGAGSDSFDWLLVLKKLSSVANILIADKPGFLGTDPHPDALTQEQIALDIIGICAELKIHSAHLIGHSLGYLSALNFAHQSKGVFDTLSITSLDGISFNPLSIEVIKRMAPKDSFVQRAMNKILGLGLINLSPREKDYPKGYFNHANESYVKKVIKLRGTRRHNKSILLESTMTPYWCEHFSTNNDIKKVLADIPQHCLQAVEETRPFGEQPEVKYFPQLRQLFLDEFEEKISWCRQISNASSGIYKSIDSEHFIQWHYPHEVSCFMNLVLKGG